MTMNLRSRLLGSTLLAVAAVAAAPVSAQSSVTPVADDPATATTGDAAVQQPGESAETGDIVVTGSRIPQPNITSPAPLTVVGRDEFKIQGVTRVEDLLNTLPSVSAGQTSGVSNDATGTATVDLRGLGVNRTLVLVNGRRLMPGDPNDSSADLNAIPEALIKRVEVLTGGASSTYGADAVAGVVNFIMDTDFRGFRLDGQYSLFNHDNRNKVVQPLLNARQDAGFVGYGYPGGVVADGGTINVTAAFGVGIDGDRGHITGYAGYRKVRPVIQGDRDYSACTIQDTATALQCGGSATSAEGNALVFTADSAGSSTFYTVGPDRTLSNGVTRYNFAPNNYFQRPDERYTAGFFADYEVSDAVKPYAEFMFMDDRTLAQIAPSGDFGNTYTINSDNPLISPQQRAILFQPENLINGFIGTFPVATGAAYNPNPGDPALTFIDPTTGGTYNRGYFNLLRRNVEGGSRVADLQHTQYRGVFGVRGNLTPALSYDAFYQYGRTNYSQVYSNEFSVVRLNRALDVVAGPDGTPVCRSVRDGSDPSCVPYDVFTQGGASAAAVNYLSATGFQSATLSEQVAQGSITGKLGEYGIQSPLSNTGVGFNVGFEYRKEKLDVRTDNAFQTGDLTGQGGRILPTEGSFNVKEVFAELQVPIIEDNFIDSLTVSGGYRYSKYDVSSGNKFSTDTYRFSAELAPIRDIRFRGSYNRAVRAPNLQELFSPNLVGLDGSTDPCAGFAITADDVGCLAQGLRVGQVVTGNPAGQYNALLGGTPTLEPERATTKTIGVVLQPSFLRRLAVTVDYYDIKVKDAIQAFGSDAIINYCTDTADPFACSLINRNPAGSLWLSQDGFITNLSQNIGGVRTKGIDVGASFSQPIGGAGTLALNFQGTYLDEFSVDNGLSEPYDCVGYYGTTCSQGADGVPSAPNPRWRHRARATFTTAGGIGLSAQWRRFGAVKVDFRNPSSTTEGDFDPFSSRLKAQNYLDLATSFTLEKQFTFRLGVNNVLDRQPPLVTSGRSNGTRNQCPTGPCNGNTYPAVYDALGRYLFAGVTLDF